MHDQAQLTQLLGTESWRLTPATMAHHLTKNSGAGAWIPARHLLYISQKVARAIAKGNGRVIVMIPPRHGKSELLSVNTPPWVLDRDPRNEIILTSYGAELATDFGRKSRDHIIAHEDELSCEIRKDAKQVARFLTTVNGGMRAVGIGGPITGRGADLLLVDDYLKNAKDASSQTTRDDIYEWFVSTAMTRLEPGGSAIILATRWDRDDLIGRLITKGGWEVIRLPALALEEDELGREIGEALWPERYNRQALLQIKKDLGSYFWEALYQQGPISRTDLKINESDFQICDVPPALEYLEFCSFTDLAASEDKGDYTSRTLIAKDLRNEEDFYIFENKRFRKGPGETKKRIKKMVKRDNEAYRGQISFRMEQEPGSAGKTVISDYRETVYLDDHGNPLPFEGIPSTGDKFVRAQPFYAAVEAHNIFLMRGPWNEEFIDEAVNFPGGANDDQVDSAAGGYNQLKVEKKYAGTFGRENDHVTAATSGRLVTGVVFGR